MQVAGLFRWAPVSPQHSSCITCSIGSASRLSPSYTLHSDPLRRLEIAPSAACAPCADSTRGNFRTEQRWLCPAAANGGLPVYHQLLRFPAQATGSVAKTWHFTRRKSFAAGLFRHPHVANGSKAEKLKASKCFLLFPQQRTSTPLMSALCR